MTAEKMAFITAVIKAVMMIMTIYVVPAVRAWLKAHAEEKTVRNLQKWADIAVCAAEQYRKKMEIIDPEGDHRRAWARHWIMIAAEKMKMEITEDQIDMLIESAVNNNNCYWKNEGVKAEMSE